ncbi:MAG TPA: hypothetical protein VGN57_12135 [Pirellulaceae bacterium]|jgi:hypothetical protein|nr:hypothetical protein [Pirellulaceae bacterium]
MAARKHVQIAGLCLIGALLGGLACVFLGSQLDTILPHFLLDHVLSPEELRDEAIRDRTLEALKAAKSGHARYWYLVGGLLVIISGVGLWAISAEMRRQEEASDSGRSP